MSTVSLEEFLKPFSAALGHDAPAQEVAPIDVDGSVQFVVAATQSHEQVLEKFLEEVGKLGVKVARCASDAIATTVAQVAQDFGGGRVLYANVPEADACALPTVLQTLGMDAACWNADAGRDEIAAAQEANVGITFAFAGIAETGSVLQKTSAGSGRAICTIPPCHIAVLREDSVYARLGNAMDALEQSCPDGELPSNVTMISGPSSTADIELVRVVGVHGPVHTAIVLVGE